MTTEHVVMTADVPGLGAATLCDAFALTVERFPDGTALRTVDGAQEITWSAYARRAGEIAAGLAAMGIGPGDTVAMMLSNRPEAFLVDTAAMHLRAIPFSIYNTSSRDQLRYLLGHAESRVIVTEAQFLPTVTAVRDELGHELTVVTVDDVAPGTVALDELERSGFDLDAARAAVEPGDVATLIYTSGTTGPPKGVELTHDNLLAEWRFCSELHPMRPAGRLVSYLPMAHLADRVAAHYAAIVSGASVTCVPDPRLAVASLPQIRPTMFMAVPRIWEKLRAALAPAFAEVPAQQRPTVAKQLRTNLGLDGVDLLLSGAAPIAAEVLSFFADLGLEIYEVWGMTETTAASTLSPKGAHRVGTVGRAIPGVEVMLADDGELLVRGPTVMRGYRNDPVRTAEALDAAGWMHTGDIGSIDEDGFVRIVDRKKELIINAAGKNMSPANIENAIKAACPLVGSAVAIGDARPYNTALIVLDPEAADAFAARHGLSGSLPEVAASDAVRAAVAAGIESANERLSRVEQIKKHTLLPDAWEPGGDELTPTMKLRRKEIAAKYVAVIESMYA
jgi:long-chain acyl-CoA synthetase